jgi:hypothetical protein
MSSFFTRPSEFLSDEPSPRSGRNLIFAWVAAALVVVSIFVGRAAGTAFLSSQGYSTNDTEPPGLGLVSFIILSMIVLVPVTAAVWFGLQASRGGRRTGNAAALFAFTVGGALIVFGLPLFLSRLVGWPVVLGCAALAIAVGFAIVSSRSHRSTPRAPKAHPAH